MRFAVCVVCCASLVLGLLAARPVSAIKYMSIGDAVKTMIPAGSAVVKVTKALSAADKARISRDYGWTPSEDSYVFYAGKDQAGNRTGYVYIQPEIFNTCFHKYAVGMTPDGVVVDTVIVELSCPRATPINKKSFLKQFRDKTHNDALTTKLDIDAVTGATLSSESAAQATRKAVSLHNMLFAGGKPVKVGADVAKARAAADAVLQKAIATGETLDPGAAQKTQ
jgi:hypothetical protein